MTDRDGMVETIEQQNIIIRNLEKLNKELQGEIDKTMAELILIRNLIGKEQK